MKKYTKKFLIISLLSFLFIAPLFVFADNAVTSGLNTAVSGVFNPIDKDAGTDLGSILGMIVRISLGLLGVIFIALIIYSGFDWMTAAGDESKVTKAKETIKRAVIGLIIVVSSFSFWLFIQNVLFN